MTIRCRNQIRTTGNPSPEVAIEGLSMLNSMTEVNEWYSLWQPMNLTLGDVYFACMHICLWVQTNHYIFAIACTTHSASLWLAHNSQYFAKHWLTPGNWSYHWAVYTGIGSISHSTVKSDCMGDCHYWSKRFVIYSLSWSHNKCGYSNCDIIGDIFNV